jgi:hypothetical protein
MLLVETQLIVSLDRLSLRVIVKGRIRALQRTDLAKFLNLAYVLCMCVSRGIRLDALCRSCGLKGRAPSVGRRAEPPSVGQRVEPPSVG